MSWDYWCPTTFFGKSCGAIALIVLPCISSLKSEPPRCFWTDDVAYLSTTGPRDQNWVHHASSLPIPLVATWDFKSWPAQQRSFIIDHHFFSSSRAPPSPVMVVRWVAMVAPWWERGRWRGSRRKGNNNMCVVFFGRFWELVQSSYQVMFFHEIFAALVHLGGKITFVSARSGPLDVFLFGIVNMDAA